MPIKLFRTPCQVLLLVILFSGLLLLGGCNERKYEEGPRISIWPAKDRVEGKWKWTIARETRKGETTNWSLRFEGDTLDLRSDETFVESKYGVTGSWALISRKNEVNLLLGDKSDSLKVPASIAFDIRRLKRKEMWLQFSDDSTVIEWQLKSLDVE